MRLLLDTHTALWWLAAPERLSSKADAAIGAPESEVLVSAMCAYEAAQKRFREPALLEAARNLPRLVSDARLTWTPLTAVQAYAGGRLEWAHRDPFDRMLVAQARDLGATLVTADDAIRGFDVPTLW